MVLSIRMNICLSFLNDLVAAPRYICSVWRPSAFVGSETRNMEMEMSGRKCDIPVLRTYGLGMNVVSTNFSRLCRYKNHCTMYLI